MNALQKVYERLEELTDIDVPRYSIPGRWINPDSTENESVVEVNPVAFFKERITEISRILSESAKPLSPETNWTRNAVVYNMFVRLTTAWDHDGDGQIRLDDQDNSFRETGTFLKSIALLPYLHHLGINTIHLLPITSIGKDGNKGNLGSPYAIRNPYKLDERLSEPILEMNVDMEFSAFMEAAHHLGIRVVVEFVFRTAAKDSDWIAEHPGWFYWIDAEIPDRDGTPEHEHGYGNPHFDDEELRVIHQRIMRNDMSSLPPPSMPYRQMFTDPPEHVEHIDGRYIGTTADGRKARVPGAFADWPPNDVQPPWNDVTYLKMYEHPHFNFIAYNTIRHYDARVAQPDFENRGLWNTIINIIPHYQKTFNIDGVMIDMGHALPRRLKQSMLDRALKLHPNFTFWEENFAISEKSVKDGYQAAMGYLWADAHVPEKLKEFCNLLASHDTPVPFFSTPETHNTKRAATRNGGVVFSQMSFVVCSFLPGILFIHQGFELGETFPVNTGLGFSQDEIQQLPSHELPLFSASALCWNSSEAFCSLVHRVTEIRSEWQAVVTNPDHRTFRMIHTADARILSFMRVSIDGLHSFLVVANMDCSQHISTTLQVETELQVISDALSGKELHKHDGSFWIELSPGQVMVIQLTEAPEKITNH